MKENTELLNELINDSSKFSNLYQPGNYWKKKIFQSQKEINLFVNRCGCYEDKEGFLTQDFFNFEKHNKFEFFSGPFTNMIFDLIKRENKFNLKCLIGNFKLTVTGKDNLFFPV